jgi:hypothetical protein
MGEIHDYSACNQVDGCTKTTEEVAECVGRACSSDARTAAETLILPTFDCPSDPVTGASEREKRKWTKRVDTMVCREDRFDEDLKKVHSLIWGHCILSTVCPMSPFTVEMCPGTVDCPPCQRLSLAAFSSK